MQKSRSQKKSSSKSLTEVKKLQKMYDAIGKMMGTGSQNITDASQKIDEILYGENGAWRGQRD